MSGTDVAVVVILCLGAVGLSTAYAALLVAVALWRWVPPVRSVEREREA